MRLLADEVSDLYGQPVALTHGWLPLTVQVSAAAVLLWAIGWRTRRWRMLWLPSAAVFGVAVAIVADWYVDDEGLSGNAAPWSMWCWIGLTGLALAVLLLGWSSACWWRRGGALVAVLLCLCSAAIALNTWVGYLPTVQTAWHQLTEGPLPRQLDMAKVRELQESHEIPVEGVVAPVSVPSTASGFKHREELVYLPPAWFATNPPPPLPAVVMIGAEFQNPTDWIRIGNAADTADTFAADHGGNAPVLVFADTSGSFSNDTECVNGPRGNAADHITKDLVPFVNSNFGTRAAAGAWGVVGFSMGGTCAITLAVMHPELFGTVVDIAGDLAPNAGNKQESVDRLFGGNADAYDAFDPTTVMRNHGRYTDSSAWFASPAGETGPANALCKAGRASGLECSVTQLPGKHDWPFAAGAFAAGLPWLAGVLDTPGTRPAPFPRT